MKLQPGGPRIVCIAVPLFTLAARLRSEPELRDEAVAVLTGKGQAARILAATKRARRAGVRAGFTLAQARARLPKLIVRPRDHDCERAAQEALLDVAESFSPRVEDAGEGLVYLDAEGLHRHFPGDDPESDLARAVLQRTESKALLPARVGLAASKLAAFVAAQDPQSPKVIAAGREADYLAPLPLTRLSGQATTLATLEQWGIRSLGEFARLPVAEVISRLGSAGQELYAVARGEDPRPLAPRQPPPTFVEGLELEWPLVSLEPFLFVARAALERLVARMEGHGLGCIRLELALQLEPLGRHERTLTLPAPTRDAKTLLTLVRLELEARSPGAPILAFTLTAFPDRPRIAQLSLFGPAALSPDKLATTLARLFTLLGEERVGAPRPADVHRPEGFRLVPFAPPAPPTTKRPERPGRGLLAIRVLRPPVAVEVMTESSAAAAPTFPIPAQVERRTRRIARDDIDPRRPNQADEVMEPAALYDVGAPCLERPISLKSLATEEMSKRPKITGPVKVASGPWGLEEEWWAETPLERDYWDVELQNGGLYRLYRDRKTGDWFVDGIYD